MDLSEVSANYLAWIETEMRSVVSSLDASLAGYFGMMQYHMGWMDGELRPAAAPGGKRVRPLLCLLSCAAVGGDPRVSLPAAAGLELLHNFSLIHDDIEDNSPLRRHRPTLWALFGMPHACNAGDGMFSLAHLAFHRLSDTAVSASTVREALRLFDTTCLALTEGQYLDISFETRMNVTVDEYSRMIAGKTGALLAAAPQMGALLGGAMPATVAAYREFGAALGRAFQLQDDILGIWGSEGVTGKSSASDILSKKKSMPVVYALTHHTVGPQLTALYAGGPFTELDVPKVLSLLEAADARSYVELQVSAAVEAAHATLCLVEANSEANHYRMLGQLLDSLVGRTM